MEGDWTETLPDGEQVPVHTQPGESLSDVYDRVQQAIDQAVPLMESGHSVLFVAHAHVLRILTARWLGSTRISRVCCVWIPLIIRFCPYTRGRVIERWNC